VRRDYAVKSFAEKDARILFGLNRNRRVFGSLLPVIVYQAKKRTTEGPTRGDYPMPWPAVKLRRSREVTQVCSRKVTHQNGDLAQGKCAVWMARTARRLARGWDTKTLRAFGADEIATFTPCPRARPVLRMGHSI